IAATPRHKHHWHGFRRTESSRWRRLPRRHVKKCLHDGREGRRNSYSGDRIAVKLRDAEPVRRWRCGMADWLRGMAVGDWYQAASLGDEPFEIVAVDVENEVVLVQHFD